MSQIGTLVTGAGVTTVISGQAQCESILLIGDITTANPLQGLQVEIGGTPFINIQGNQTLLTAIAKWRPQPDNGAIGSAFVIATGKIPKQTNYKLTNAAATTPAIYAFSDNDNGVPILAGTKQINASSYDDFDSFSALFIGTPANLTSAEIVFMNGTKTTLTPVEVDALYNLKEPADASGRLGGVTVIDNTDQSIKSVRLYCSAANTIAIVKVPDAAFKVLKAAK